MLTSWSINDSWSLLAGLCGATLPLTLLKNCSPQRAVMHWLSGAFISIFVAPAVCEHYFSSMGWRSHAAVAFATGVIGAELVSLVLRLIRKRATALADVWLKRWIN
jgi:uncharacterized membrane protein YeaQ/YmgE (transglycosylase-associated protein family)